MVKVSELGNQQLLKQILKYRKILDALIKEREARLAKGHPGTELLTAEEIAQRRAIATPAAQEKSANESSDAAENFQLEIDVEEIERIRSEEERRKAAKEDEEEEVRVTQLLKLSKDQIAELKKKK